MRIIILSLLCMVFLFYACDKSNPTEPKDSTPPTEVSGLKAEVADRSVTLTWVDPNDADFDHIEITFTPTVSSITQPAIVQKGVKTKMFTGMINYVTYTFIIKTVDKSKNYSKGTIVQAKPKFPITQGSWTGTITNTTYQCLTFSVTNDTIRGTTTVKFPFSNVTITNYIYDKIPITDGRFYYTRGNVTSSGGQIIISGTFTSSNSCNGTATYNENSYYARANMQYNWIAHP